MSLRAAHRHFGITLIEIMIGIAVALGLMAVSMLVYATIVDQRKAQQVVAGVTAIESAVKKFYPDDNYTDVTLSELVRQGALGAGFVLPDEGEVVTGPWGGIAAVTAADGVMPASHFSIDIFDMGASGCHATIRQYASTARHIATTNDGLKTTIIDQPTGAVASPATIATVCASTASWLHVMLPGT